jgi:hypothetical protein
MCQYLIGGRKHWLSALTGKKGSAFNYKSLIELVFSSQS